MTRQCVLSKDVYCTMYLYSAHTYVSLNYDMSVYNIDIERVTATCSVHSNFVNATMGLAGIAQSKEVRREMKNRA